MINLAIFMASLSALTNFAFADEMNFENASVKFLAIVARISLPS
ncbi:MAG: hypothetical protein ACXVB4_02160 [Pseudobdellovibrionaceae bacterium]